MNNKIEKLKENFNGNLYINRELSWLDFNKRVLEESEDELNPLLERLKFLAIFGTNLDEFFMVRVAGLKQQVYANITTSSFDGLTPKQQLIEINKKLRPLLNNVDNQYEKIISELKKHKIYIHTYNNISDDLRKKINNYFDKYILPILTPLGVDATHPYPHIVNLGFNILVKLHDGEGIKLGIVPIPKNIPRFIKIDNNSTNNNNNNNNLKCIHYVLLEDIIMENMEKLFPNKTIKKMITYRLTRDADIRIQEDEAGDLLGEIEKGLKYRRFGKAVRLEIKGDSKYLLEFLKDEYDLTNDDIYKSNAPLNLGDLWQLYGDINISNLKYPNFVPFLSSVFEMDLFSIIDYKDLILYNPYDSFEPVVDLINRAANDPDVLAIKMTLYRTGKNSPIVAALKNAVDNGKEVTAVIELKARFDEESNISWAKYLEEEGAHVVYGIPKLKIHGKVLMVVRKEGNELKRYVHIGTGNYNCATAKVYTDLGLFTSNEKIGKDVEKIFNAITGYFNHPKLDKIYISPNKLKNKLIELIRNEAKNKEKGRIIAKMNSLVDVDIINELYLASKEGVKIDLIVRGICCLRPGIKGLSENINVISIVGKYLEHARIFYFKNEGGDKEELYISSADWMPRNFNKRIELMTPIESEIIKEYIKEILDIQLKDTAKVRILKEDGNYIRPEKRDFNSQEYFEKWVKMKDINNI